MSFAFSIILRKLFISILSLLMEKCEVCFKFLCYVLGTLLTILTFIL